MVGEAFGQPLADTLVIEWCELACGPYAGKWLAEGGADVVKIEAPGVGDVARSYGPFPSDEPHPERSGLFLSLNTNKRSITLDPEQPDGLALLRRLLERADVLLEDRPADLMERLGLTLDELRVLNPRLVVTSITPFGREGPNRDLRAEPLNVVHASGGTYHQLGGRIALEQFPDGGPVKPASFVAECDAGLQAALATLAALFARTRTGEGQLVDLSRQWAMAATQRAEISRIVVDEVVVNRNWDSERLAGVYECSDGHVTIGAIVGVEGWSAMAELVGNPDWSKDERFEQIAALPQLGMMEKPEHVDEVSASIAAYCREHTREEIAAAGQALGLTISGVFTTSEVLESEQMRVRGFLREREHPEAGTLPHVSFPFRTSTIDSRPEGAAPLLGEHTAEVLSELLGVTDAELAELHASGVV